MSTASVKRAGTPGGTQAKVIDLRSDTVTRPTDAMWDAMRASPLGDDTIGDDPTVKALEARAAELLGKEAAVFSCSGTQSNLIGILAHCGRGDEYIVGQHAHTYRLEAGGAAVLGSVQPQPLPNRDDGTLDLAEVEANIKPHANPHFAMTRLLALENTWNGRVLPRRYQIEAAELTRRHELGLHLDGARFFNAAVAGGDDPAELAAPYDSVSLCLSKGLGCPAGAVLVGPAELINRARRHRKILGGSMRQAGVLAGAGLYALDHHRDRLADDHARARRLAQGLAEVPGLDVAVERTETNMVFVGFAVADEPPDTATSRRRAVRDDFIATLAEAGIKIVPGHGPAIRMVTHLDVDDDDIEAVIAAATAWSASHHH